MRTFSRFSLLTLSLVLGLFAVGCDSSSDDPSDAERFEGNWVVSDIADDTGNLTQAFGSIVTSLTVNFEADKDFVLALDYNAVGEGAGFQDITLTGTYAVIEASNTLTLNVTSPLSVSLGASYNIVDDNTIRLELPASIANAVFNPSTPYQGTVKLTVTRLS